MYEGVKILSKRAESILRILKEKQKNDLVDGDVLNDLVKEDPENDYYIQELKKNDYINLDYADNKYYTVRLTSEGLMYGKLKGKKIFSEVAKVTIDKIP